MTTSSDKMKRARKGRAKDSSARLARILDMIEAKPMTMREIASVIGADKTAVRRYLFALQLTRNVHVESWTTERGQPTPKYAAGDAENAPQPARRISARKYDFEGVEDAMRRANQAKAARIKPFRDPLIAAMYGDAA